MVETLTEVERKVINILVGYGDAPSAYADPFFIVNRAMGWATEETAAFVRELVARNLIRATPTVRSGLTYNPRWQWEEITD